VDEATKTALIARFRTYLDCTDDEPLPSGTGNERADLYTLFVELAGLRTEVRTEARLIKEALDQTKAVVDPLRTGIASMERALRRAESALEDQEQRLLKPLILELLEIRDRLAAGIKTAPQPSPGDDQTTPHPPRGGLLARLTGRKPPPAAPADTRDRFGAMNGGSADLKTWQEGLAMTLRRLDAVLAGQGVEPIAVLGHAFDPRTARAIATDTVSTSDDGTVLSEVRPGFRWRSAVLRPADVVVNRTTARKTLPEDTGL